MKQIALSLFVIAASGTYVWEQASKAPADDMLGSALPADAAERDSAQPVIPAAPVENAPPPGPAMPEIRQQNVQLAPPRLSAPPAISEETTAATGAPTPKPETVDARRDRRRPAAPLCRTK
ncbi:hypothetical protein GCM10007880_03810 [Mesorhizobium amorphae]|uniref:Uncharacterized protein n=1 Tax=Mesorhizobium amorphae CCNWGS0123 TaxID=1082933 RepID=G6Y6I4_9HYPH|nr:hypothetical protein MEA186_07744 [Mesorhizobium amorphae CCNWGS0123]GLR39865.1 hypothetical protein GCM10007880_03810 [Mesorhizobium amorphae]